MSRSATFANRVFPGMLLLVANTMANAQSGGNPLRWTVSFDSFGPVKVGMAVHEAERVLKMKLLPDGPFDRGECHYVLNERELPGIRFMVLDDEIARIDVSNKEFRTASGAQVGMTEEELKRLYPRAAAERHPYDEAGHYFRLTSHDRRYGMIFETDGRVVTAFRSGKREPVGYIEGCL